MKYYSREITIRKPITKWGKLGYVRATQFLKTNNIDKFNKRLKIKFEEIKRNSVLLHCEVDKIITVEEILTDSEAYFRKSVSKHK